MALSDADRHQLAAALTADPKTVDWKALLKQFGLLALQWLLQQLSQVDTAKAKAAGCPDGDVDTCCSCARAACLALQSAEESLKCCGDCCQ